MKMKVMQVMLVVAAALAALGISVALSRGGTESAAAYQPSALMESLGSLVGPPMLSHDELTDAEGRPFPSQLQLPPDLQSETGTADTFTIEPADARQRRAEFSITGLSPALSIRYEKDEEQQLDDWPEEKQPQTWQQGTADNTGKASFVIFDKGGQIIFNNPDKDNSSTVTIRMEE